MTKNSDYTMHEDTAPAGYATASDIAFTIGEDGQATSTELNAIQNGVVTMTDQVTAITFSKEDIADSKELAGAKIQILDKDGKVATYSDAGTIKNAEWTSANEARTLTGIKAGEYTMHEVTAPDGYAVTTDILFTVNKGGTVTSSSQTVTDNKIVMKDSATSVTFSKTDLGGTEIGNARIEILESDGKTAAKDNNGKTVSWTSEAGKSHEVTGLAAGTYVMHEDTAPAGYTLATDIVFTIAEDGKVSTANAGDLKNGKVTMTDQTTTVTFSKVNVGGTEIAGADIRVLDVNGNIAKNKDGMEIEWTSEANTSHVITGLAAGTYTMHEAAAPGGYRVATDISFTIAADGTVSTANASDMKDGKVVMTDTTVSGGGGGGNTTETTGTTTTAAETTSTTESTTETTAPTHYYDVNHHDVTPDFPGEVYDNDGRMVKGASRGYDKYGNVLGASRDKNKETKGAKKGINTGDHSCMAVFGTVALAALIGLGAWLLEERRRRDRK